LVLRARSPVLSPFPAHHRCCVPRVHPHPPASPSPPYSPTPQVLTTLLQHCDIRGVWKLKSADGFGNFWASCVAAATDWAALRNLNCSHCGLASLPGPALGALTALRILRASHNRLAALPGEVGRLGQLEVLAVDHNALAGVPGGCGPGEGRGEGAGGRRRRREGW
jgi:hypothetical protein